MTTAIALYVGLTLVLASWVVIHALATAVAWRREGATPRTRVLDCLPPFAALAAAQAGHRDIARAWVALAVLYVVLLALAAQQ